MTGCRLYFIYQCDDCNKNDDVCLEDYQFEWDKKFNIHFKPFTVSVEIIEKNLPKGWGIFHETVEYSEDVQGEKFSQKVGKVYCPECFIKRIKSKIESAEITKYIKDNDILVGKS